jgi:flagellar hook-length control protein FliK
MLALVASLNLPGATAQAAVTAPPVATDGALTGATAAGLPGAGKANMMGKLDGKVLDVAAPLATDGGSPLGQPVERVVADAAPVLAEADPATAQPKGLSDAAAFGMLRARDGKPDPAAFKDLTVAAPTAAPVQQASLALAQAAAGVATDKIAARVGTPGWDQQVGQKVVWMVAGKEQRASLTLNPPDMGPMQVVLSVTNDQATVTFSAHQPEVRQALEDAMPKLRDMLGESGIALGNASVNDGSAQQQAQAEARQAGRGNGQGSGPEAAAIESTVPVPRRRGGQLGAVDTFA